MLCSYDFKLKDLSLINGEVYTICWCRFQDVIVEHIKLTDSKFVEDRMGRYLDIEFTLADSEFGYPHQLTIPEKAPVFIGKDKLVFSVEELIPLGREREKTRTNRLYYKELMEMIISQVGEDKVLYAYYN